MAYSDKNREMFAGEIEEIKEKGLFKEKRFICSPQDAEIEVEYPEDFSSEATVIRSSSINSGALVLRALYFNHVRQL